MREDHRHLLATGYSQRSVDDFEKFGHPAALLYSVIDVPGAVLTPKGQGTLVNVQGGECRVQLVRGRGVRTFGTKKPVKPTESFPLEHVKPQTVARRIA